MIMTLCPAGRAWWEACLEPPGISLSPLKNKAPRFLNWGPMFPRIMPSHAGAAGDDVAHEEFMAVEAFSSF
jgi:hypothetical protein